VTIYKPRSEWTSAAVSGDGLSGTKLRGVAVHWPGTTQDVIGDPGADAIAARLRSYRNYHVGTKGWRDIGYNLAIDQGGRVWMCRSTQWKGNLEGAHCASAGNPDANEEYVGVLLLLGDSESLGSKMITAFQDWYHTRFLVGWPGKTDVRGHRQVPGAQTNCPGDRAIAALPKLKATPQEEDMPLDATDLSKIKAVVIDALSAKDDYQSSGVKAWAAERGWGNISLRYEADQAMAHSVDARNDILTLLAQVSAIKALTEQVVGNDPGNPLSAEQVKEIVENAIRDNVVKVDVTVTGTENVIAEE
jgi:hypothetical protein